MALMIVRKEGNFRRPKSTLSFNFKPSSVPQSWPRDVVEYAISKGLAVAVVQTDRSARRRSKQT